MENNFNESKEEKEEVDRGHQEQSLRCSGGVCLPGLQRDGGQQVPLGWPGKTRTTKEREEGEKWKSRQWVLQAGCFLPPFTEEARDEEIF